MHQSMRERTVRRNQEQTRRIDIEPADCDPAPALQLRQIIEYGATVLRIVARRDFADGLVVRKIGMMLLGAGRDESYRASIELDLLVAIQAIADLRDSAVHDNAAFADPALDLPPRT
jgi:hypothetical protein